MTSRVGNSRVFNFCFPVFSACSPLQFDRLWHAVTWHEKCHALLYWFTASPMHSANQCLTTRRSEDNMQNNPSCVSNLIKPNIIGIVPEFPFPPHRICDIEPLRCPDQGCKMMQTNLVVLPAHRSLKFADWEIPGSKIIVTGTSKSISKPCTMSWVMNCFCLA